MKERALLPWALLALVFVAALAIRVVPGWSGVYEAAVPNLQGGDAYYHLRSIESLIANFPRRSGFDPYALYPGGMNVPTGPFFDYVVAAVALAIGLGDPSPALVEHAAAWIPPIFGALAVLPVFLLGRGLLGWRAGLVAAAWMAVCPGHTVFYAKLGFADHHIFETLFYGLLLAALAAALKTAEDGDRVEWRYVAAAGAALGFALLNRPAAAFVSPLVGVWAALQAGLDLRLGRSPARACAAVVPALLLGWIFLAPAGVGAWGVLPHVAMASGVAAALTGWVIAAAIRGRGWPTWVWPVAICVAGAAGLAAVLALAPGAARMLQEGVAGAVTGGESRLVAEVRSLLRIGGAWSVWPLLAELGPGGLVALPAFVAMGVAAVRSGDRVLSMVAGTGALVYVAALLQARMSIYAAVNLAVALGWCTWKLVDGVSLRRRVLRSAAILAVAGLPSALVAAGLVARNMGMSAGWRGATTWLRNETAEPLGDPGAYLRYYPRLAKGERFEYPPQSYGVLTWWDYGYWVLARARRAPITNGTQAAAREAAAYFTSTRPDEAGTAAAALGARYVVVDHTIPAVPLAAAGVGNSQFRAMPGWTHEPLEDFMGVFSLPLDGGGATTVLVLYPKYFEAMAIRLYLHDGDPYEPRNATTVFALRPGDGMIKTISSQRTFATYEQARRYMEARPDQDLLLGSMNPFASCVPLEAVDGLRLVYNSTPGPVLGADGALHAVKVFERTGPGLE